MNTWDQLILVSILFPFVIFAGMVLVVFLVARLFGKKVGIGQATLWLFIAASALSIMWVVIRAGLGV